MISLTPQFEKGERIYIATKIGVLCRFVDGIIIRDTMQHRGVQYEIIPFPGVAYEIVPARFCYATEAEAEAARCDKTDAPLFMPNIFSQAKFKQEFDEITDRMIKNLSRL